LFSKVHASHAHTSDVGCFSPLPPLLPLLPPPPMLVDVPQTVHAKAPAGFSLNVHALHSHWLPDEEV
jgi:hypothetical protein